MLYITVFLKNNIMKNILVIAIFTIFSISAFSQFDRKAKEILDEANGKINSYSSMRAEFDFIMENKQENIYETIEGKLLLKEDKYKLDLMDVLTFCDGITILTYMKDANEVNISEPDTNDNSILSNPTNIFSSYQKGYKYKFIEDKYVSKNIVHIIELYPEKLNLDLFEEDDDESNNFSKIVLHIDQKNKQIRLIKFVGKDGNNYTIDIKKFQSNEDVDDKSFIFNAKDYEEVEVIDLRD